MTTVNMAPPDKRSELVAFRLSKEEFGMLQELASADGVYQSDALRQLVRRAYNERFGAPAKGQGKKRRKR